jgi:hypothetical protein
MLNPSYALIRSRLGRGDGFRKSSTHPTRLLAVRGNSACSTSRSDGLADHLQLRLSVRFIGGAGDVHPGIEGPASGHTAKNRSSKVESRYAIEVPTRSDFGADPVTSGSEGLLITADAGSGSGRGRSLITADTGSGLGRLLMAADTGSGSGRALIATDAVSRD